MVAGSLSIVSWSPAARLLTPATLTVLSPATAGAASVVAVPGVPTEVTRGPSKVPVGRGPAPTGKLYPEVPIVSIRTLLPTVKPVVLGTLRFVSPAFAGAKSGVGGPAAVP